MDAKQFLNEFSHVALAPGGVQRIRELVLQLAVSGDLTVSISNDTNANDLLTANKQQQERLIARKELKRQPAPKKIYEGDQPWRVKDGWMWCRLGDVTSYGQALKAELEDIDEATWVLELKDIEKRSSRLLQRVLARNRRFKSTKNRFGRGAVLYGKLRPYLDKVLIADEPGVCTTEIAPISFFGGIESGYLRWYLKSPFFVAYATNLTHGMNLPRLGTNDARNAPFPFPPAQEQKLIVKKVNELMGLCDELESQEQLRMALRQRTRIAVLNSLSSAHTVKGSNIAWRRLQRSLPLLVERSSDVGDLRALILDLAATGRLSESQSDDGSAQRLIEEAAASRVRRIAEGKMKKKRASPTTIKQVHIPIPSHWAQASMEDLFQFIDYRGRTPVKTPSGRVLITAKNVRPGRIAPEPVEYISEDSYRGWMTRGFPRVGDLLITTEAPLGNVAQIKDENHFAIAQRVINLQPYAQLNTRFFMYFIMSPSFQHLLLGNATGTTAKGIKAAKLKRLKLSVPPSEEQERIVQVTESLLSSCDDLEIQMDMARSVAGQFASSCTTAITGIRIEDKEKMKAPKTELVSTLQVGVTPTNGQQAPLTTLLVRHQGELSAKLLWGSSGMTIDDFYNQLKTEMSKGWIVQPEVAYIIEVGSS